MYERTQILKLAANIGQLLLESGSETHLVEEIIRAVCHQYGYPLSDAYVTPTGIMISLVDSNSESMSIIRRVDHRGIHLNRINRIEHLIRKMKKEKLSPEQVVLCYENIAIEKKTNWLFTMFFSGITASFYCLLFKGTALDFINAFIIGCVIAIITALLQKIQINSFFINAIGGASITALALFSSSHHLTHNMDTVIIGSIMLLAPGLAITNAIRDTIAGDYVSGLARGVEAFLVAISIAAGTGLVFRLWMLLQ